MHLEILSNGSCRPLAFRRAFPARHLVWHDAQGKRLAIDTGYGPRPVLGSQAFVERLYERLFRVCWGKEISECDELLLTHHHLDHAGGSIGRSCTAPPRPSFSSPLQQLHHATFARTFGDLDLTPLQRPIFERFGFEATPWHDLEVLHLPGHTADHHGVYFPALHLLYVCDAVWWIRWLDEGRVPRWARPLQENPRAFDATFQKLVALKRKDPQIRFRCAHDPEAPLHETIPGQ